MPPQLKYPNKSHRKIITIPQDSIALAELIGIEFGDGGINNNWQLVISLNSVLDLEYSRYVYDLLSNLFNISVSIRKRPHQNTLVLVCSSMNLVDFLTEKGAARGNKILHNVDIPSWIKDNDALERAFVRGLIDTDGCLYIHRHYIKGVLYQNIGFCFTSFIPKLIKGVCKILLKNNIQPHLTKNGKHVYLYSSSSVIKYLNVFGSSNPRILNVYTKWRGV